MVCRCVGAIIGDIIGSRFEFNNHKSKKFDLFTRESKPTDDSYMTLAVMNALRLTKAEDYDAYREVLIKKFKEYYRKYPDGEYGGNFADWCESDSTAPYHSLGNGALMRVSPCAWVSNDLEKCLAFAEITSAVTHNHPSALFWVEHLVTIIYYCRVQHWDVEKLREYVKKEIPEEFHVTMEELREFFFFNETCDGTMPAVLACVLESTDFVDAIQNAVSIGGDTDTICAIVGSIAEVLYEVPNSVYRQMMQHLPQELRFQVVRFDDFLS